MNIEKITIIGGIGREGSKEPVDSFELKMGDVVSIVGPTGCGKTTLLNDIELYANENTPTKRKILINDQIIDDDIIPSNHLITLISQHTSFLSDLPIKEFLEIHAKVRNSKNTKIVDETIEFANQLTGEPINKDLSMTQLSGGQTRSLLIADAVVIGNSPVILLDEIENAGIHRAKALELLKKYKKIFIFVTHNPQIALLSDFRIAMKEGKMMKILYTNSVEKMAVEKIKKIDNAIFEFRRILRNGEQISEDVLNEILKMI